MGKRIILTLHGTYFPTFGSATARSNDDFRINTTHTAGLELLASNTTALCVSAGFLKTGLGYGNFAKSGSYFIYTGDDEVPATISIFQYSVGIKTFKRNKDVPLGFYMKWELVYQKGMIRFDENDVRYWNYNAYGNSSYLPYSKEGKVSYKGFGAAYSLGWQRIFFDRLVLDYGVRFALHFPYNRNNNGDELETELFSKTYERILEHQLLNVRLGLGFLAF
jgi:hypothetical protein